MKLSQSGAEIAKGVAALEERKRLAANAEGVKIARGERLAKSAGCSYEEATAILEMVTAAPGEYGIVVDDRPVRTKPIKQTTGMVRSIEECMVGHLLAYESLSRLLPEDKRAELRDPIYHAVEALEKMGRPHIAEAG